MANAKHESMSFCESVDRIVDRVALAIGLGSDAAKVMQRCNALLQLNFPVKFAEDELREITRRMIISEGKC